MRAAPIDLSPMTFLHKMNHVDYWQLLSDETNVTSGFRDAHGRDTRSRRHRVSHHSSRPAGLVATRVPHNRDTLCGYRVRWISSVRQRLRTRGGVGCLGVDNPRSRDGCSRGRQRVLPPTAEFGGGRCTCAPL